MRKYFRPKMLIWEPWQCFHKSYSLRTIKYWILDVVTVLSASRLQRWLGGSNITMCDISEDAVRLAKRNIVLNQVSDIKVYQSDGLKQIGDRDYTLILSNPPYHADFSVPKAFIEQGYKKLAVGGRMYMVTKRKEWYKNKLISVFGGVKIMESNGYYVFMAEKIERGNQKYKVRKKLGE